MVWWSVLKKSAFGTLMAVIVWWISASLGFPHVFQVLFVLYIALGVFVFILLDVPPMKMLSGGAAIVGILVFYLATSLLYIAGSTVLPQYDPHDEKGKIEKLLTARYAETEEGRQEALRTQVRILTEQTESIMQRLETLGGTAVAAVGPATQARSTKATLASFGDDPLAAGKEVYDLYECYNCHKIGGKGGVKKRGPHLDNLGGVLTKEQIKDKIFNPKVFYAEGFEKEYEKGLMPVKYKELMTDGELEVLAMYLASLKDASVNTPKPMFP